MKLCVVVLLGAADRPLAALDGRTPLGAARTPVLSGLAEEGRIGSVLTIPKKVKPSVEAALATLFGLDAAEALPGAGALLAAALDLGLEPGETAFRCDLVNQYAGTVVDPTAGALGAKEAGILTAAIEEELGTDTLRFLPGIGWRSLLVAGAGQVEGVETTSPARFLGEPLKEHLPGRKGNLLRRLMEGAGAILTEHEINAVRVDLGENPANGAWIWGGGRRGEIPGYPGAGGIAVGTHPSLLGLAREAGLDVRRTDPGVGLDREPEETLAALLAALDEADFVVAALEGGLVLSRLGEAQAKMDWCEAVDEVFLGPLAEKLLASGDGRLLLLPSHAASTEFRRDCADVVPFLVAGPGISSYGSAAFSEAGAEAADLKVADGRELMEYAGRP